MHRFATRALALASFSTAAIAEVAAAHPGHGTPHLLHEGDAALGWWVFAAVAAALTAGWAIAKIRR